MNCFVGAKQKRNYGGAHGSRTLPSRPALSRYACHRRRDPAHGPCRIQELGPGRPDLCRTGRRHSAGRRVHEERMLLHRSGDGPRTGQAGPCAGTGGQCRQLECLHRLSRARGGGTDHGASGSPPGLRTIGRAGFLHRRDRRAFAKGQGAGRDRGGAGGQRGVVGRCGANYRYNRHFRQGRHHRGDDRRHPRNAERHHQGKRHDRARHGDDARLRLHRCRHRSRLSPAVPVCRQCRHVQLHHRG